ncbi:MAG: sugar-binding domain-containing protein [bacterium]
MHNVKFWFFCLVYCSLSFQLFSQVTIKEINANNFSNTDSLFFNANKYNKIIALNKGWKAYIDKESPKVTSITVPAAFEGQTVLYFEKSFTLSQNDVNNNNIRLYFLGLNHTAEIYINNLMVYKSIGGELPFTIDLAKDVLKYSSENKLIIKITRNLDSENTIPVNHRFLFPQDLGGITRDIYLKLTPIINIANVNNKYLLSSDLSKVKLSFSVSIDKKRFKDKNRDFKASYPLPFVVEIAIYNAKDKSQLTSYRGSVSLNPSELTKVDFNFEASNPKLWSFNEPNNYIYDVKLLYQDLVVDRYRQQISFYNLDFKSGKAYFNKNETLLRGITYYLNNFKNGNLVSFEQIENDLRIIKDMGFNTIRFARSIPNPYALYMCEKLGLMAYVEVPINSIPAGLLADPNFRSLASEYLKAIIRSYSDYSSVAAIGVGSSFLPDSPDNNEFISYLATIIKKNSSKFSYASFGGFPTETIANLDLYGVELFSTSISEKYDLYLKSIEKIGKENIFISEATYPTFTGSSNGYLTPYSLEAQADYYEDLLDFTKTNEIPNVFINTAFDFTGNSPSFYAGFNDNNIYKIGVLGIDRNTNRISYKVIKSKLSESEKVTIPIGKKLDDTPFFFIIISLFLSILTALFINARRKFREDATRALVRPYNFFADIRDQRILSGFHANILLVILAGAHSLLLTNLLFALRANILLEKIIVSTGLTWLIDLVVYLAWSPVASFIYLFVISALLFLILALVIKGAAFFVRIRVYFSSIYFVVIWAFLPLALLLPIELVLYKVLALNVVNIYVYLFLALYALWLIQRLLKGVYVIFDVVPIMVYLLSFVFVILIIGTILFSLQLSDSTVDFILNSISQFKML